eukprot:gene6185-biopygen3034
MMAVVMVELSAYWMEEMLDSQMVASKAVPLVVSKDYEMVDKMVVWRADLTVAWKVVESVSLVVDVKVESLVGKMVGERVVVSERLEVASMVVKWVALKVDW